MKFFKKLLDILHVDNSQYIEEHNALFSLANNSKVHLKDIRAFWNMCPQSYHSKSNDEATKDEYLTYGITLMLWAFRNAPLKNSGDYPVYFIRECHISNPQKLHLSLIENGYFGPPSIHTILSEYKMKDLRIIADSIGCKKSGNKDDLIYRIIQNLSDDEKEKLISSSPNYNLTEKGKTFLESNYDYVELHRHQKYIISLKEFNQDRIPDGIRKRTFYDNAYQILSKRIYQNCLNRWYFLMSQDYLSLYDITINEHLYDIALDSYLRSIYIKTCCISQAQYRHYDVSTSDFNSVIIFTSKTAKTIIDLSKFYNESFVSNIYKDLSLPPSFISEDEFKTCINEMITEIIFDYEKYNNLIRNRLSIYSKLK